MHEDLDKTRGNTLKLKVADVHVGESAPILVQLAGPGAVRRISLSQGITQIGRDALTNDVVIGDRWVSREHARVILTEGGSAHLEDRESRNGSNVNSQRVDSVELVDGDLIQIGPATFKFLAAGSAEAPFYQEVFRLAFRDPVTGTYSRRYFDDALARESLRVDRIDCALCVLLIDVDQFKRVNDSLGHQTGDEVLAQTASVLQATLRGQSIIARFGGDEFAILLPDTELDEAVRAAERVREAVEAERMTAHDLTITISVGLATTGAECPPARLLAAADAALYRAKRHGRNRVEQATDDDGKSPPDPLGTQA